MSQDLEPTTQTNDDDLWLVKLADGTVRSMTVDAMDDAFQSGELDASTSVQAPDGEGWTTLGAVAGLDETAPPAEVREEAEARATSELQAAQSEARVSEARVTEERAEAIEREREPSRDSIEPPSSTMPSLAPMVASIAPPSSSFALSPSERPSSAPLDLDLDHVEAELRAGKRKRMFGFAAVVVGVVLCGAAVSYVSGGERPEAPKAAAQTQEVAPPPPAVDPATAFEKPSLTEEQKKRLSDADKARNGKKVAPSNGGAAAPHRSSKEANPFQNGGDKYDPLNGSL